jgi:hypothetical protein
MRRMATPPLSPDGSLYIDGSADPIAPRMTLDAFERSTVRAGASLHLSADGCTCKLAERRIAGNAFHLTLTFGPDTRLASIDLFPVRPGDERAWSGWTLEQEMDRKRWLEAWAAQTFGAPLRVKPFELDTSPEPIYPTTPGPDHPRHAVLPWGEVCSYFDSKAGFAGLWIRYTDRVPPPAVH